MESIVTFFCDGTTRTRIIDWVSTWSPPNLESSSDPSSSTVNAPVIGCTDGADEGLGDVNRSVGEGVGTRMTCPVESSASCAAGMKYEIPPATDDSTMASTTRKLVRSGLSRRRDALMRRPALKPRGTEEDCRPGVGIPL